jgi:hypothetical protein
MRVVQTVASTRHRRASVSRPAPAGTSETASCFILEFAHPTSYLPSLKAVLLPAPSAARLFAVRLWYYEGSDSRSIQRLRRASPLTPPRLPTIPPPTTQSVRWSLSQSSQRRRLFQASPGGRRLATDTRRIGFVSYGLAVRLQLLPTPPHNDAVAFGCTATTYCDRDLHPANKASSRTHDRASPDAHCFPFLFG